jgi:hypothetical protein
MTAAPAIPTAPAGPLGAADVEISGMPDSLFESGIPARLLALIP